jgi:hypothetical protein
MLRVRLDHGKPALNSLLLATKATPNDPPLSIPLQGALKQGQMTHSTCKALALDSNQGPETQCGERHGTSWALALVFYDLVHRTSRKISLVGRERVITTNTVTTFPPQVVRNEIESKLGRR